MRNDISLTSINRNIFADKSANLYKVSREHFEKFLQNNITQT